jgi:hypothetical protein
LSVCHSAFWPFILGFGNGILRFSMGAEKMLWKSSGQPINGTSLAKLRWFTITAGPLRILPVKRIFRLLAMTLAAASAAVLFGCERQPTIPDSQSEQPKRVEITGYEDDAMEPFISRDGRYLLFNNLNEPATNTDIHFAERKDDFTWLYHINIAGEEEPVEEHQHGRDEGRNPGCHGISCEKVVQTTKCIPRSILLLHQDGQS